MSVLLEEIMSDQIHRLLDSDCNFSSVHQKVQLIFIEASKVAFYCPLGEKSKAIFSAHSLISFRDNFDSRIGSALIKIWKGVAERDMIGNCFQALLQDYSLGRFIFYSCHSKSILSWSNELIYFMTVFFEQNVVNEILIRRQVIEKLAQQLIILFGPQKKWLKTELKHNIERKNKMLNLIWAFIASPFISHLQEKTRKEVINFSKYFTLTGKILLQQTSSFEAIDMIRDLFSDRKPSQEKEEQTKEEKQSKEVQRILKMPEKRSREAAQKLLRKFFKDKLQEQKEQYLKRQKEKRREMRRDKKLMADEDSHQTSENQRQESLAENSLQDDNCSLDSLTNPTNLPTDSVADQVMEVDETDPSVQSCSMNILPHFSVKAKKKCPSKKPSFLPQTPLTSFECKYHDCLFAALSPQGLASHYKVHEKKILVRNQMGYQSKGIEAGGQNDEKDKVLNSDHPMESCSVHSKSVSPLHDQDSKGSDVYVLRRGTRVRKSVQVFQARTCDKH